MVKPTEAVPQRDEHVWFMDGTIIILAENTIFRVYKGLLSYKSEVFRDLFALSQPADAENIDGVAVVRLEGTSANDARIFLACLHDNHSMSQAMESPELLCALFRMSHKYLIADLQQEILSQLSLLYPDNFEGFQRTEDPVFTQKPRPYRLDFTSITTNTYVANLARDFGLLRILPLALYRLCRAPLEKVFASDLSEENLRAVVLGRAQLSMYAAQRTLRPVYDKVLGIADFCRTAATCGAQRQVLAEAYIGVDFWLDPLVARNVDDDFALFCSVCRGEHATFYLGGRRAAWVALPELLGLGASWDKLVNAI